MNFTREWNAVLYSDSNWLWIIPRVTFPLGNINITIFSLCFVIVYIVSWFSKKELAQLSWLTSDTKKKINKAYRKNGLRSSFLVQSKNFFLNINLKFIPDLLQLRRKINTICLAKKSISSVQLHCVDVSRKNSLLTTILGVSCPARKKRKVDDGLMLKAPQWPWS